MDILGLVVPWLRRRVLGQSPQRPELTLNSVHVGFVVDYMALTQVYFRVFRFPFSESFHKYFKISDDIILATVSILK
jgi:hypothetical protein